MPVEAKPLLRCEVLRPQLMGFHPPGTATRETIKRWSGLLWSSQADTLKEQELLPDFKTDIFCGVLGYVNAAYGLSAADVRLMRETAPPRMPLASGAD